MPTVDMKSTGNNIRAMIKSKGYKISDIQKIFGFGTPQAIYKWMRGDSIPNVDNLVVMADIFGVTIADIIAIKKA